MKIMRIYESKVAKLNNLKDIPPLLFRLVLAYGFYTPAMMKWQNISGIAEWFAGMGIPMPLLNAYLAASTEFLAVILLPLGLGTRIIAVPLMITMLVAIKTVHMANGFEAGDNGFEIPLYYLLLLFGLFVYGSGKISLDYLVGRRRKWQGS
ncbi:MAG: DoxX family protein [Bacteroidales bacterium]|nr:DoxX family protein [Bacteroidales bacterium]